MSISKSAKYQVKISPSAQKDLDNLPIKEVERIFVKLKRLINNPRPIGVQKLSNKDGYRIRSGRYRILYAISDKSKEVIVFRIKHRKEVYK